MFAVGGFGLEEQDNFRTTTPRKPDVTTGLGVIVVVG